MAIQISLTQNSFFENKNDLTKVDEVVFIIVEILIIS